MKRAAPPYALTPVSSKARDAIKQPFVVLMSTPCGASAARLMVGLATGLPPREVMVLRRSVTCVRSSKASCCGDSGNDAVVEIDLCAANRRACLRRTPRPVLSGDGNALRFNALSGRRVGVELRFQIFQIQREVENVYVAGRAWRGAIVSAVVAIVVCVVAVVIGTDSR